MYGWSSTRGLDFQFEKSGRRNRSNRGIRRRRRRLEGVIGVTVELEGPNQMLAKVPEAGGGVELELLTKAWSGRDEKERHINDI
ncbi:hypothetical protein L1987_03081 [Smallanthus sonchifolius]|uniref:Uncharacterized protein n=1 Tax=Smallanthus sonchifolius TaxID=185202 RepID=A0ACB9K9S6_9ASTR|nr:hypothetical protein L1987_03081 [Smallanthus sonchifolius]